MFRLAARKGCGNSLPGITALSDRPQGPLAGFLAGSHERILLEREGSASVGRSRYPRPQVWVNSSFRARLGKI